MYNRVITLTEHILDSERHISPRPQGNFTLLLTHIENAAKIIASHIKRTGLVDILGATGATNAYSEEVQKLDEFSNNILVDILLESGLVSSIGSEELEKPLVAKKQGDYVVYFDPLDGSSNIDVNVNVGTIFSIYHKSDNTFQPGNKQIAAGYILYGSSVMFVYTCGKGVNGFTLDPSIGSFLLSHPDITIPDAKNIYSFNEGSYAILDEKHKHYFDELKKGDKPYSLRYIGSMVADIHRTLLKGGIFLYPESTKNPEGKLRLLFEVNPMSFIIEQAGGAAFSSTGDPLALMPQSYDQRIPIALGSKKEIEKYQQIF